MILMQVSDEKEGISGVIAEKQALNRTYFGPIFPEPPEFKDPNRDLAAIGVRKIRVIARPYLLDLNGDPK